MIVNRHNRCVDRAHAGGIMWAVKFGSVKTTLGPSGRTENRLRQTLRRNTSRWSVGARKRCQEKSESSEVRVLSASVPTGGRRENFTLMWPCRFTRQGHALEGRP